MAGRVIPPGPRAPLTSADGSITRPWLLYLERLGTAASQTATSTTAAPGAAPDVLNFEAGHKTTSGTYDPVFYWDASASYMLVDFQADLPLDTTNFGGIQMFVTYPDGAGGTVTDAIGEALIYAPGTAAHSFQSGQMYTLSVNGNIPDAAESWTVTARSINTATPPVTNASGPSVTLATVTRADAGPPQPTAGDITIGALTYQYDETGAAGYGAGTPIAQVPVTVALSDPAIDKFYIWWAIGSSAPALSDYKQTWTLAPAASGPSSGLYNVPRPLAGASAQTLYLIVLAASTTYDRAPVSTDPVTTVSLAPVGMPSQVTGFSVSFSTDWVSGAFTGFLTYNFTLPNDPEIAWVNIMRVQCDDPALHGGAYVPMAGKSWGDVWEGGITRDLLGTSVSYTVTMPLDAANSDPGWWSFKCESSSRAGLRNTTADPAFNLATGAVGSIDLSFADLASIGGGLQLASGQLQAYFDKGVTMDASGRLIVKAGANINFDGAGNLIAKNLAVSDLTVAGTAVVTGDFTFQRSGTTNYVGITSTGVLVAETTGNHVSVTSGGIVIQQGVGGPSTTVSAAGVQVLYAANKGVSITSTGILIQQGTTGPYVQVTSTLLTVANGSSSVAVSSSTITITSASGPYVSVGSSELRMQLSASDYVSIASGTISITGGAVSTTITSDGISTAGVSTGFLSVTLGPLRLANVFSSTASTGSASLPANPVGFITFLNGITYYKIPYYNA